MDGMFAGNTDPVPFITASYAIGLIFLIGMPIYTHRQYAKLQQLLASLESRKES
jgi:hypothetical protein